MGIVLLTRVPMQQLTLARNPVHPGAQGSERGRGDSEVLRLADCLRFGPLRARLSREDLITIVFDLVQVDVHTVGRHRN